jgi:hypothetical protein
MKAMTAFLIPFIFSVTCFAQVPDKKEWGEKFNSNGARLDFKESGRDRIKGQTAVTYSSFAYGLPKDDDYTLWTWIVGSDPEGATDAYINRDGLVVNVLADPLQKIAEDPLNLIVFAGRGEPKKFALISNDGHYRAFGQVVPFPIENVVGPCHISAEMLAPNYFTVLVVLSGLQPNEGLQIDSQSAGEGGAIKTAATDQGTYYSVLLPFVKGKRSGITRWNVTAKLCSIGVEFPWGESSYKIQ